MPDMVLSLSVHLLTVPHDSVNEVVLCIPDWQMRNVADAHASHRSGSAICNSLCAL